MYRHLRIIFTVISALCVAAILPVGAFWQFSAAITLAAVAGIFYFLMLICKQKQEELEATQSSAQTEAENQTQTNTEDNTQTETAPSETKKDD